MTFRVRQDIENFGIESARQPHLAGLDYVKSGIHNLEEFASNINKIGDDTLDTKSHTYSREEPYQRHEENDNNGVNVLPVPESVSGTTGDAPDIDVTPPDEADVDGECESDADDAHYDAVCSADDAAQRDASAGVSSATVTTSTVADSDPADGTTSSFVDSSHDDVVGMSDQEEPVPRSSKDDYSVRDASSDDSGDAFLGQDASTNAKSDKTDDASGEEMATTLPVCTTASAKVSREVNGGDAPQILTFSDGKEHDVPTVSGAETLSNPLATTVSPQNIHGHGDDDNSIVGEEMGSTDGIDRTIGTSTSKHSTTSDVLDAAEDPNTEGLDREPSSTDHYRRRLVGEINPVATTIPFLPGRQPSRQPRRPTMKVGEQMTRREVLTSGDGGTTLSLAGDASILLKRSPVCPDAETVDPTVSDPLPQNPTPPDVNGEGHDDMEEGASVLLPANRRKVHAVQQKKASTQEQQTNGHHQKMVFLKILLRDFMFGLNMEAQEDGLTLRKNGRWGDEFEAASYESEGIKGPTGAGAGNRKHEEVPDEGAEGMADKSRGKGPAGWFGWRRRRRNSKSGKNLDGEVVMSVSSIGGVVSRFLCAPPERPEVHLGGRCVAFSRYTLLFGSPSLRNDVQTKYHVFLGVPNIQVCVHPNGICTCISFPLSAV